MRGARGICAIPEFAPQTTRPGDSETGIYFIAALSPKGFGRFEEKGWVKLREFIANAYLNPDTTIMFSTHFGDLCHGCGNRTNQSHVTQNAILDHKAMVRMDV